MSNLQTIARATVVIMVASIGVMQMSALKTAAGGTSGANGFSDVTKFLDTLATYVIYLAIPAGALGIIAGGGMLIAGNPSGPSWLARTAVGVGIVLLAKGIMA